MGGTQSSKGCQSVTWHLRFHEKNFGCSFLQSLGKEGLCSKERGTLELGKPRVKFQFFHSLAN